MLIKKRVMIIGIDGATFNIINPLIQEGKLPTLKKLIRTGSSGILNSTIPPVAATGWTSLVTGKNSGKHDIYDFFDNINGSYDRKIINSKNVKTKKIWEILGEQDLKSILVNIPITYPPTKINGIMISGMLSPYGKTFTYPEYLSEHLVQQNYIIDLFYHIRNSLDSYMETALQTIKTRQRIFLDLINNNDWDLAMVTFSTPDRIQHSLWQHLSQIQKFYISLDSLIGELIDNIDDNTYLMILSVHGFKSITKKFFVNEWLWELGHLSKEISTNRASIPDFVAEQFGFSENHKNFIKRLLAKAGITKDNIRSIIPNHICEQIKKVAPDSIKRLFPKENLIIKWDTTKAYFTSQFSQGININLKGREPQGTVESGIEFEQLRDQIIHELCRLKDPHTFEKVVDEVFKGEEIFFGEYSHHAPDIIFIPHNYNYLLESNKRTNWHCISSAYDDYPIFSHHDPYGIFIMNGPSIKCNNWVTNINIFDIAPTVLKILNVPSPNDMDGRVIHNIFEDDDWLHLEEDNYPLVSRMMPIYDIGQIKYDELVLN